MLPQNSVPTLFLDFDGVLFDSLPEAFAIGRAAFYGNEQLAYEAFPQAEFDAFRRARFLITHSAQYWCIFKILEACGNAVSVETLRQEYAKFAAAGTTKEMEDFNQKFLDLRKKMMRDEHEFWLSLSRPYPFFEAVKPRFESAFPPIIVTTKNRDAVLENLARERVFCPRERILDKQDCANFANDKGALIANFMRGNGISRGIFIDDSLDNIRACSRVPALTCLHAGWGYCNPAQAGLSAEEVLQKISI